VKAKVECIVEHHRKISKIDQLSVDRLFTYFFVAEDAFLANGDYTQFSVVELDGFKRWSSWIKERFAGYSIDPETMIITPTSAPRVNFQELMQLFLSKDWTKE